MSQKNVPSVNNLFRQMALARGNIPSAPRRNAPPSPPRAYPLVLNDTNGSYRFKGANAPGGRVAGSKKMPGTRPTPAQASRAKVETEVQRMVDSLPPGSRAPSVASVVDAVVELREARDPTPSVSASSLNVGTLRNGKHNTSWRVDQTGRVRRWRQVSGPKVTAGFKGFSMPEVVAVVLAAKGVGVQNVTDALARATGKKKDVRALVERVQSQPGFRNLFNKGVGSSVRIVRNLADQIAQNAGVDGAFERAMRDAFPNHTIAVKVDRGSKAGVRPKNARIMARGIYDIDVKGRNESVVRREMNVPEPVWKRVRAKFGVK